MAETLRGAGIYAYCGGGWVEVRIEDDGERCVRSKTEEELAAIVTAWLSFGDPSSPNPEIQETG